ncbi:TPA: glycosyltransferase, partial [Klebsiella quasipneumoniae subsp. similipneumoniae]
MRIVHAAEVVKGGVSTVIRQLIQNQVDWKEIEEIYCIVPNSQLNELSPYYENINTCTFERKKRSFKACLSFLKVFITTIWRVEPDIVHLHSTFAGFLGRISLIMLRPWRNPKVIYCPHAFSFLMEGAKYKRELFVFIEKMLSNVTDKIICVSKYEYNSAVGNGIDEKKLRVIYNGTEIKDRYNKKNDNEINMLFIGRLDYQKGYDILLSAMEKTTNKDIRLTVVGSANDEGDEYKESINIKYMGWISPKEIDAFYKKSDVVCVPSRWEGFAMVPLEAMSYSTAVIASNSTSLPEVIDDHKTGLLFENNSIESLCQIL